MSLGNLKPPRVTVPQPAGRTEKEKYDPRTGHLLERTVEEAYWLEIIFGFIGVACCDRGFLLV